MERVDILLCANAFLIFAAWFGMWGNLWIRYESFSRAEFRGACAELQEHNKNGYDAALSFGFLTYTIDYFSHGVRIQGLPTFCWTQFFLLVLAVADIVGPMFFLKRRLPLRAHYCLKPKLHHALARV